MPLSRFLIPLALALTLTACGRHETATTAPSAPSPAATALTGKAPPKNLPDFAAPYPGARVGASMESGAGGLFGYTTSATPEQVMAFYEKRTASGPVRKTGSPPVVDPGSLNGSFSDPDHPGGAGMTVNAVPEGGATRVSIMYSTGG